MGGEGSKKWWQGEDRGGVSGSKRREWTERSGGRRG